MRGLCRFFQRFLSPVRAAAGGDDGIGFVCGFGGVGSEGAGELVDLPEDGEPLLHILVADGIEELAGMLAALGVDGIIHPHAHLFAVDKAGVAENFHVVGECGLAYIQLFEQAAGALLTLTEHFENHDALFVGKRAENLCKLVHVFPFLRRYFPENTGSECAGTPYFSHKRYTWGGLRAFRRRNAALKTPPPLRWPVCRCACSSEGRRFR